MKRLLLWIGLHAGLDDALVGDIVEDSGRSRSVFRACRQLFSAIAHRIALDVRAHVWLASRAIALGWMAQLGLGRVLSDTLLRSSYAWQVNLQAERWLDATLGFPVLPPIPLIAGGSVAILVGWLVSSFHRPYGVSMAACFLASLWFVGAGLTGTRGLPNWLPPASVAFQLAMSFCVLPALTMFGAFIGASSRDPNLERA